MTNSYLLAVAEAQTEAEAIATMAAYVEHGQPPPSDSPPSTEARAAARDARDRLTAAHAVRHGASRLDPVAQTSVARDANAIAFGAQRSVMATHQAAFELADAFVLAGADGGRATDVRLAAFALAALLGPLDAAIAADPDGERVDAAEADFARAHDRATTAILAARGALAAAQVGAA